MLFISPLPPSQTLALIRETPDVPEPPTFSFGLDVARFGSAHNTLWLRHRNWIVGADRWSGLDTVQTTLRTIRTIVAWEEEGWICTSGCIDVIGVGGGVCDNFWHAGERFRRIIKPINVGMQSSKPARYRNVRAELAWLLRRKYRAHKIAFICSKNAQVKALLDNGILHKDNMIPVEMIRRFTEQATTLTYKADESHGGVIMVESKADYIKRMQTLGLEGKSPDEFDAMCLAFNEKNVGLEKRPAMSERVRAAGNFMSR